MQFYIVDDSPQDLVWLRSLLALIFPQADIAPERHFTSWDDVWRAVSTETSDSKDQVIFLDLSIPTDIREISRGVREAYRLKLSRPKAVFIAHTQYPDVAERQPHYREIFKATVDKQAIAGFSSKTEEESYLRRLLGDALNPRLADGRRQKLTRRDSLGLRLFEAVFGTEVFSLLADRVVPDWDEIEFSTPSLGHSGSYVLRMVGTKSGAERGLILKCARDAQVLEREIHVREEFLAELGELGGVLGMADPELTELRSGQLYFYRQALIRGDTMGDILGSNAWGDKVRDRLQGIVALEEQHCKNGGSQPYAKAASCSLMLTDLDRLRALSSREFLEDIGNALASTGRWPDDLPSVAQVAENVMGLVQNWDRTTPHQLELFLLAQHGDLHPGNVIVPRAGQVVLIDHARLGRWPVGYDVSRLATMIRVRLPDQRHHQDWVQSDIRRWDKEHLCLIDKEIAAESSDCPPAVFCDQTFRRVILSRPEGERDILSRGYLLGTLWDLIKVMSYVDLSPFKKVWAMTQCWRLAFLLGYV